MLIQLVLRVCSLYQGVLSYSLSDLLMVFLEWWTTAGSSTETSTWPCERYSAETQSSCSLWVRWLQESKSREALCCPFASYQDSLSSFCGGRVRVSHQQCFSHVRETSRVREKHFPTSPNNKTITVYLISQGLYKRKYGILWEPKLFQGFSASGI